MKAVTFDIDSDGDFSYNSLFTSFLHNDEHTLFLKTMENLRYIEETMESSSQDITWIKNGIKRFTDKYYSGASQFYDEETDCYFDVATNHIDFGLDWGNWKFHVCKEEIEIEVLNNGFLIK